MATNLNEKGYPIYCQRCLSEIVYIERDDQFIIKCKCNVRSFKMFLPEIKRVGKNIYLYSEGGEENVAK